MGQTVVETNFRPGVPQNVLLTNTFNSEEKKGGRVAQGEIIREKINQ